MKKGFTKKLLIIFIALLLVAVGCTKEEKTYKVTFDTDGGSKIETIEVKEKEKLKLPDNPTKEGFIFKGWMLNNESFDKETKITKDITLKANWGKETFTIIFDTKKGNEIEPLEVEKGKEIEKLPIPTREGYKFVCWEDKNGTPIYDQALLDEDITLYAVWEKNNTSKEYYCDEGYTLKGSKCIKTETVSAKEQKEYVCPEGYSLAGKNCTKTETENAKITNCSGKIVVHPVDGHICRETKTIQAGIKYTCPTGYQTSDNKMCVSATGRTEEVTKEYYCPEGYTLAGKNCTKTINKKITPKYACDNNYTLDKDKCTKTTTKQATIEKNYFCDKGYELKDNKCIKTTTKNAKTK